MIGNRSKGRPKTETGVPYLKMKELAEAAEVPWSTIQYYVQQGFLPKPVKTSRNMAWYPPDFVDRIRTIKKLQSEQNFQLSVIKRLIKEKDLGFDLDPLVELRQVLFSPNQGKIIKKTQFLKSTGLSSAELEQCLDAGLLVPLEENRFDEDDVAAGKIFRRFFQLGLTAEELAFFPAIFRELVKKQMEMRETLTEPLSYEEDAAVTAELIRGTHVIRPYIHNRILEKRALARKSLKDRDNSDPAFHGA